MLARLGWIGCSTATGLLLQIALQIQWLHWLPDFPIYPALALLAGGMAMVAAPMLFVRSASKSAARGGKGKYFAKLLLLAGFALLAIVHAALAARSSSTAVEGWRNLLLWLALLAGLAACVLTFRWPKALLSTWSLGEAAVAILACWYAPSLGESHSLRAYQYVLVAALLTALALIPVWLTGREWTQWPLWGTLLATAALPLICLVQPDPEQAQSVMALAGALRFALISSIAFQAVRHANPASPAV